VSPTYDQIIESLGAEPRTQEMRKELDEIQTQLAKTPTSPERSHLEQRTMELRIWVDLILPEDFLSFVVSYALGMEKSDIKLVTEEMLIQAAVLAELGHDNPADHIAGRFTDFNREDINRRGWSLWQERKRQLRGKNGKHVEVPNGR